MTNNEIDTALRALVMQACDEAYALSQNKDHPCSHINLEILRGTLNTASRLIVSTSKQRSEAVENLHGPVPPRTRSDQQIAVDTLYVRANELILPETVIVPRTLADSSPTRLAAKLAEAAKILEQLAGR